MAGGGKKKLSRKAKQEQKPVKLRNEMKLFQPDSGFGDHEPTRNTKELHFKVWDWIKWDLRSTTTPPIQSYGFDLTQNFFADVSSTGNVGETKNRVRSVTLEVLTPAQNLFKGAEASETVDLFLVLASVPVLASDDSGSSLVGQSSTVIHPDVRRPWVKVGHWDFTKIFTNTQFEPVYYNAFTEAIELFRFSVTGAISGNPITIPESGDDPAENAIRFRVCTELACPIGLVPEPVRIRARAPVFAGAGYIPVSVEEDTSACQYELVRMADAI